MNSYISVVSLPIHLIHFVIIVVIQLVELFRLGFAAPSKLFLVI